MEGPTVVKNKNKVHTDFFAFLVGVKGTPYKETYPILQERVTIGRGKKENDIALPDDLKEVHRSHALIAYDYEQKSFFIKDRGTENGTFVNGKRVVKEYLKDNAFISLSDEVYLIFKRVW